MKKTQIQRFEEKISIPYPSKITDCWMWKASKNRKGYGHFGISNGSGKRFTVTSAHRFSYELYIKKIPQGMQVLHHCDNPSCVNPRHLFLGTNLDNVKDKVKKGRTIGMIGEKNGRAILNKEQVRDIKKLYATGLWSQISLAKKFGVGKSIIGRILTGLAWTHL